MQARIGADIRKRNMTVETKAMTNESEDSQDETLDTAGEDQSVSSTDAEGGVDEQSLAEASDSPEPQAATPAEESAAEESAAKENAAKEAVTKKPVEEDEDDDPSSRLSEVLPEDLADEEGGDNEYDDFVGNANPIEEAVEETEEDAASGEFDWYILKVQSNREKSICAALQRRVSVAGLDEFFKEIIVPTEKVAEFKNGKRREVKRKLYPGYIVANMALNDETWFLVRETSGIGDFTGAAGKPTPMMPEEVDRIVKSERPDEEGEEQIKTAIPFKLADRVRIKEGTFENFEGDVEGIDEANGRVTVTINIFGRSTPVELEHWQIEAV